MGKRKASFPSHHALVQSCTLRRMPRTNQFFFRFSLCVTCEQALPGVQGWGEEREEWERTSWRACSQSFAGYTLRHCVVWARSNCNIRSEYSIVFCSCYPRSILTSFTSNCLLSTRLRHLTAFDDVVFAFNLMFHSDLWTAVALNSFHVSPLTLVAGTLCCVRNQNSTNPNYILQNTKRNCNAFFIKFIWWSTHEVLSQNQKVMNSIHFSQDFWIVLSHLTPKSLISRPMKVNVVTHKKSTENNYLRT